MAMTGRFRFRRSLTGNVILQVEHDDPAPWPLSIAVSGLRWRDARLSDLLDGAVRGVVELMDCAEKIPESNHGSLASPLSRRQFARDLALHAAMASATPEAAAVHAA